MTATRSSVLRLSGLRASVQGHEILRGIDLELRSGEVHALMGPNGSGKSTLSNTLMGWSEYEVTAGSVTIDGTELLGLPTWERARAGLFLAMQYPVEVPGVTIADVLEAASEGDAGDDRAGDRAVAIATEAERLAIPAALLDRGVNDEFSGGERKRAETLQLALLRPRFAILDEIDSGLDVDALRDVSRRVEEMTDRDGLGVLAITHYARLLEELRADRVHILLGGRIVASGGPELADRLEARGYEGIAADLGIDELTVAKPDEGVDPFLDPTLGANPLSGPDVDARRDSAR